MMILVIALGSLALFGQTPNPQDDKQAQAIQIFAEARTLAREGTAEARQASILKFETACRLLREVGNKSEEANCLGWLGNIFLDSAEYARALGYYEESLPLFRELGDKGGEAFTLNSIGTVYYRTGETNKALDYYNQSLALRRKIADKSGTAGSLNNIATVYDDTGEKQKALDYFNQAVAVWTETGDEGSAAIATMNTGRTYSTLGEKRKALNYFAQALAVFKKLGDKGNEATALNNTGSVYLDLGENEKAREYFNQALAIHRSVGNRRSEAITLSNIAFSYAATGDNQKALDYNNQALAIFQAIGNLSGEATTLLNIGDIYTRSGETRKNIDYTNRALLIYQKLGYTSDQAVALNNLGLAYSVLGEQQKALDNYLQALPMQEAVGDRSAQATTLTNIGLIYSFLGEAQTALAYFNKSLVLRRAVEDKLGEAATLLGIGLIYSDLSDYQKALDYDNQALAISRSIDDKRGAADALGNIGSIYRSLGEYQKSLDFYSQSLANERAVGDRNGEAITLNNFGFVYETTGEKQKALDFYQQALPIYKTTGNRADEAMTLSNIMFAQDALGKKSLAVFYGKQALVNYQNLRRNIENFGKESQKTYLRKIEYTYRKLAEILIAEGRLNEAQQVLDAFKDQQFFDFNQSQIKRPATLAATPREANFAAAYQTIGERVATADNRLNDLRQTVGSRAPTANETAQIKKTETDVQTALNSFSNLLKRAAVNFAKSSPVADRVRLVPDTRQMQSTLARLSTQTKQKTVAVYQLVGADNFYELIVAPDSIKKISVPIKATTLDEQAKQYWQILQSDRYDPAVVSKQLYDTIFKSLEAELPKDTKTILWSLDGSLRYIPMAALSDGKRYLVERFNHVNFTRADSERMLRPVNPNWTALGLGSSESHTVDLLGEKVSFSSLPGTTEELAEILKQNGRRGGIFNGQLLQDARFTKLAMLAALKERRPLVHIASHFAFRPGDEARSFLLLGDGTALTLDEMKQQTDLFSGVDLLTLSACNTAATQADASGREVDGFAELAQRLGAGAVLASLWSVADESTTLLMSDFYRNRKVIVGITKAEAMRRAQIALLNGTQKTVVASNKRSELASAGDAASANLTPFTKDFNKPFAHPYYWSPFVLIGNWR